MSTCTAASRSGRADDVSSHPWDVHAGWWHDTFTNGADVEYEVQILPVAAAHVAGCERVLDLGAGEGQLARRVAAGSPAPRLVAGLDPSAAQLAYAVKAGGGPAYVRGTGEGLPFRDGSFDAVVCCLVIEHADDPDLLLAEAVRVLAPGGRFVLLVNHPIFQGTGSGFVDDQIMGERYWRVGPYLREETVMEEVDAGVALRFAHRPLSRYVNPVTALGCVLTRLEEPDPPLEFLDGSLDLELEAAIPRLLVMRFERLAASVGD